MMEAASPASDIQGLGPPPEDDIWHFLAHIDAPQWADLHEEAVLSAAGLEGDDPWFHTSHENHEKSLDELAEETGTLTLAQPFGEEAGASPLSMASPKPGHRKAATPSPAKSVSTDLNGSLHRIDLSRLGGGAQRLHSRPRRVTPEEEAASSISLLEPTTFDQPRAVSMERTPHSIQAWGAKLTPEHLGALAGIMQYGADSPDSPPREGLHQAEEEGGVGGAERQTDCRRGEGEGPSSTEPSSSGQGGSSGRGMQLPVAAASRPGALAWQTDRDYGAAGGEEESRQGGRKKGRQKSLGDALRVPKQAEEHESKSNETRKRSPLVQGRPRKSADSLNDSSEKVKLAFGRRIEPPEQHAAVRRQAHQALPASPPLPLKKDKSSVHPVSKTLACAAPTAAESRTSAHPTAASKLTARSSLRPLYETPPSSASGSAVPGQARTKLGRTVAARTDTGQRQPGPVSGAGARGPLATLANGNTSRQPVRSASAKGGPDKKAVRVPGPGLRHVAVGFTAAPRSGAEASHMQRSSSATARGPQPRASISPASESENRAPQSTSAPRLQAGTLPEEDQEIAAMLAQHNRKFKVKPAYEPRMHSVRDTKEWERLTGKVYYTLDPGEREEANEEIHQMKQSRAPLLTV